MAKKEEFLSATEARKYLGVAKMTLFRRMKNGDIPYITPALDTRFKLVRKSDLDKLKELPSYRNKGLKEAGE